MGTQVQKDSESVALESRHRRAKRYRLRRLCAGM